MTNPQLGLAPFVVTVRSVYGNDSIYPASDVARSFAAIAGTRTLSRAVIGRVKALGYEIIVDGSAADRTYIEAIQTITGAAP